MAHSDDAELWTGGTLARHAQAGATVTTAVPRTNEIRGQDAAAGTAILGGQLRLLDQLTRSAVYDLLSELRPEVVITHNPDDIHSDHQRTALTLFAALPEVVITTGHPRRVYTYDGYHNVRRDGRPLHLPVIVDVTCVWDIKMRALTEYASQPIAEHFAPMAETLGRLHGGRIGVCYAEAFAPVPVLGQLPTTLHL